MANEYKLGTVWRVERGVISWMQVYDDEVFVMIECPGLRWKRWRPCSFSREMFVYFCEKIGMPEWVNYKKAVAYNEDPPVYVPDGLIKGIWNQNREGEMWDLKVFSLDFEN